MDRRRRAIRENLSLVGESSDEGRVSPSRTSRAAELPELTKRERGVAYSHSVRRACQQRLVQFIPVRKLSLTGAVAASLTIPLILIALHYLVFVDGRLDWSGHPMSALLNANSPRSMAAWLSSHLWLLCLGSTVLTFQLRKHKLDDYEGEYRLWFWLVFTCVIGSLDSTTRVTELFGAALDRWSQLHVGWSGGAIVQATLATLVGMLGLRLCSELKSVPTSLLLWLAGLVMWAGSAALSQSLFQVDVSAPMRSWLRGSLWLAGLTLIWLSSLFYLRAIFMAAQKRFLSRALSTANAVPWQERVRQSMPSLPNLSQFSWRRHAEQPIAEATDQAQERPRRQKSRRPDQESGEPVTATATARKAELRTEAKPEPGRQAEESVTPPKRRWSLGLGKLALRPPTAATSPASAADSRASSSSSTEEEGDLRSPAAQAALVDQEYGKKPGWFGRRRAATADPGQPAVATKPAAPATRSADRRREEEESANGSTKRSLRDRLFQKRQSSNSEQSTDAPPEQSGRRGWLRIPKPKLPKPKLPRVSLPKPKLPKVSLPKLKLPSFRLPTPNEQADAAEPNTGVPSINASRPLPGTGQSNRPVVHDEESDSGQSRPMSKAERKRLKRLNREDDSERRAA